MGADEVYKYLKKNKGESYSANQIAEGIGISSISVARSLRAVGTYDDINAEYIQQNFSKLKRRGWHYKYNGKE